MFEDSLVVSQVRRTSSPERWTALASMSIQFALAALVIALPLMHPERLALRMDTPHILIPPPRPPVSIEHVQSSAASSGMAAPTATRTFTAPPVLPSLLPQNDGLPSISPVPFGMGAASGVPNSLGIGDAHTPRIAVIRVPASPGPLRISSGVSSGMLLAPIRPVYPEIARMARVEGTVVVAAIISRTGTIDSLRVISGPVMLQQAAIDAIRAARYQPYRLNGSATEVQTTISINFRLGN